MYTVFHFRLCLFMQALLSEVTVRRQRAASAGMRNCNLASQRMRLSLPPICQRTHHPN